MHSNKMLHHPDVIKAIWEDGNTAGITPVSLGIDIDETASYDMVIDTIRNAPVKSIELLGKTMQHHKIASMLYCIGEKRLGVHTEPVILNDDILIPLEACIPTYYRIKYKTGVWDAFKQIEAITKFPGITYYVNKDSLEGLKTIEEEALANKCKHIYFSLDFTAPIDRHELRWAIQRIGMMERIMVYNGLPEQWEGLNSDMSLCGYCFVKDFKVILKSNGDLVACSANNTVWGNVLEKDFITVWKLSSTERQCFDPSEKCKQCPYKSVNDTVKTFIINTPSHVSFL